MTLEQLRIFLAVAQAEHMTRASERLHLTQSAVSASIAALETRYSVQLFDRIGRRIQLTEAGRRFFGEAEAVLARAESAAISLADWGSQPIGRIRVFASQTVASYWLPARLMHLRAAHPAIEVEMAAGNTTQAIRALAEGHADLGIVEGEVSSDAFETIPVAEDELRLVVSASHDWASHDWESSTSIAPGRYSETGWVIRESGSGTRARFERHLAEHGLSVGDLNIVLELPSNEAVLAAIVAGRSASLLSARATELAVAGGRLHSLAVPGMKRSFSALVPRARHQTRAARALMALLTQ